MTREEFDALFTIPTVEANDEGPDAALLELFQAILARK